MHQAGVLFPAATIIPYQVLYHQMDQIHYQIILCRPTTGTWSGATGTCSCVFVTVLALLSANTGMESSYMWWMCDLHIANAVAWWMACCSWSRRQLIVRGIVWFILFLNGGGSAALLLLIQATYNSCHLTSMAILFVSISNSQSDDSDPLKLFPVNTVFYCHCIFWIQNFPLEYFARFTARRRAC